MEWKEIATPETFFSQDEKKLSNHKYGISIIILSVMMRDQDKMSLKYYCQEIKARCTSFQEKYYF